MHLNKAAAIASVLGILLAIIGFGDQNQWDWEAKAHAQQMAEDQAKTNREMLDDLMQMLDDTARKSRIKALQLDYQLYNFQIEIYEERLAQGAPDSELRRLNQRLDRLYQLREEAYRELEKLALNPHDTGL